MSEECDNANHVRVRGRQPTISSPRGESCLAGDDGAKSARWRPRSAAGRSWCSDRARWPPVDSANAWPRCLREHGVESVRAGDDFATSRKSPTSTARRSDCASTAPAPATWCRRRWRFGDRSGQGGRGAGNQLADGASVKDYLEGVGRGLDRSRAAACPCWPCPPRPAPAARPRRTPSSRRYDPPFKKSLRSRRDDAPRRS